MPRRRSRSRRNQRQPRSKPKRKSRRRSKSKKRRSKSRRRRAKGGGGMMGTTFQYISPHEWVEIFNTIQPQEPLPDYSAMTSDQQSMFKSLSNYGKIFPYPQSEDDFLQILESWYALSQAQRDSFISPSNAAWALIM